MANLYDPTNIQSAAHPGTRRAAVRPGVSQMRGGIGEMVALWDLLGPFAMVAGALVLWGLSLQRVDLDRMTDLGLVSVLPVTFYMAIGLLSVSFVWVVSRPRMPGALLALHVAALVFMVHATPTILYGTLRYSWAWKHVGIIDYIFRHGSVDPSLTALQAYHGWPGFFGLGALFTAAGGWPNAIDIASWAPVYFNLMDLGALLLIFRALTRDQRLVWSGVWLFYITSWTGQDYFSPQALTFFLYLVAIGICLRYFKPGAIPSKEAFKRYLLFGWAASLVRNVVVRASASESPVPATSRGTRLGLMLIAILALVVIAFSHQLMPVVAIMSLTLLVVFQRLRARTLPLLMALATAGWALYFGWPFIRANLADVIAALGTLGSNASDTFRNLSQASPGQVVIALADRALIGAVLVLAVAGGIRLILNRHWALSAALLIVAPIFILGITAYGGEIGFRVYLFALPFLAFLAAALFFPSLTAGTSSRAAFSLGVVTLALLPGFFLAYYGKERMFYFTPQEVQASDYLFNTAPAGSLIVSGSDNWATQYKNYEMYTYVPISREPRDSRLDITAHPVDALTRWMSDPKYPATYLIITRSQKAAVDMLGLMPAGSMSRLENALRSSSQFRVVYENRDATIFTVASAPSGGLR